MAQLYDTGMQDVLDESDHSAEQQARGWAWPQAVGFPALPHGRSPLHAQQHEHPVLTLWANGPGSQ